MKKITVTREQQDRVTKWKNSTPGTLTDIPRMRIYGAVYEINKCLEDMTDDQIAAAWLGVADIEPEPVEPWEAYKAVWEGKKIKSKSNVTGEAFYEFKNMHSMISNFIPENIEIHNRKFYILEDE
ncbi:hypothetical protein [Alkalicoccus luteus]|uniref:Uncharacterized protein n=1 Tax=Alkalicoccus luteus TaxID=1237094 RepID=A0A969PTB1_9BACI|nr:hypothetical protein [Alkalicoccus luteus]NJP37159.1 hypothetical protein [Alkalicoccus luteus]